MRVGIHEAKTHLSRLIPAALAGEDVIITKSGKPLVKLVPICGEEKRRPLGMYKKTMKIHGNITAPLPKEVIDDFWPDSQ